VIKKFLALVVCAGLSFCVPDYCSAQTEVPDGTKVRVRLDQQLSSETAKQGDLVQLSVADDVMIGEVVAIKRGSVVNGTVVSVVPKRYAGRTGKFDFSIDAIITPDGGKIPLRYSHSKREGGSRPVAVGLVAAGLGALFLPEAALSLLIQGHDAVLYEGIVFEVFTDGTYTAQPKVDTPSVPVGARGDVVSVPDSKPASAAPLDAPTIGVVYFLDSSTQTLKALPDEPWTARRRDEAGTIEVSGERSYLRIKSDKPEFVFKIGNPEHAKLYALNRDFSKKDKDKGQRWFSLVHKVGKAREVSPGIPVEIKKFGESSYRLIPEPTLRPGEYAVLLSGSKVFTFGIDQESQ